MKGIPHAKAPWFVQIVTSRKIVLLAICLSVAAFSLRLHELNKQGLECDEFYTLPAATGHQYVYLHDESLSARPVVPLTTGGYRPLLKPEAGVGLNAIPPVLRRNVHLPLYFFLMHYWIQAAGNSAWAIRFPSALFGALAAGVTFLLAEHLFGMFVGLASASFMALAPDQIYFSQQARMYSLIIFLAISSTYLIALSQKYPKKRWPYVSYAVLSIAGLYTHYEYFFFLAAQFAFIWIGSRVGRENKKPWAVTHAVVFAAFAPWLLTTITQKKTSPEIVAWVHGSLSGNLILNEIVAKVTRLISVPELPAGWISVVAAFVLLVAGSLALRTDRSRLFQLWSWIVFPIAGILLMDQVLGTRAIGITRYWLIVSPALYLLISRGLEKIPNRPARVGLLAVIVGFLFTGALLTAGGQLRPKPDRHEELAQFVDTRITDPQHQLVLTDGLNALPLVLAYYGKTELPVLRYKWMVDELETRTFVELTGGRTEIWLLTSGPTHAAKLLEDNGYRLQEEPITFGHIAVARYLRATASTDF
jgi:uncharacterized membrane protein